MFFAACRQLVLRRALFSFRLPEQVFTLHQRVGRERSEGFRLLQRAEQLLALFLDLLRQPRQLLE